METTTNNPIFSTAYFPPIAYVAEAMANDTIVMESFETYPKQTYRNRAVIATANGVLGLTVPVVKTNGNHTYTKDIEICYTENWALKHLRAIESAYNSSPYFLYYKDDVANILSKKQRTLLELNMDILAFVFKKLRVKTNVVFSDDYTDNYSSDYRNTFSPKTKEELITNKNHYILKTVHPSPLSASRGFFGCKHFSKANEILGDKKIDWQIENVIQ